MSTVAMCCCADRQLSDERVSHVVVEELHLRVAEARVGLAMQLQMRVQQRRAAQPRHHGTEQCTCTWGECEQATTHIRVSSCRASALTVVAANLHILAPRHLQERTWMSLLRPRA